MELKKDIKSSVREARVSRALNLKSESIVLTEHDPEPWMPGQGAAMLGRGTRWWSRGSRFLQRKSWKESVRRVLLREQLLESNPNVGTKGRMKLCQREAN